MASGRVIQVFFFSTLFLAVYGRPELLPLRENGFRLGLDISRPINLLETLSNSIQSVTNRLNNRNLRQPLSMQQNYIYYTPANTLSLRPALPGTGVGIIVIGQTIQNIMSGLLNTIGTFVRTDGKGSNESTGNKSDDFSTNTDVPGVIMWSPETSGPSNPEGNDPAKVFVPLSGPQPNLIYVVHPDYVNPGSNMGNPGSTGNPVYIPVNFNYANQQTPANDSPGALSSGYYFVPANTGPEVDAPVKNVPPSGALGRSTRFSLVSDGHKSDTSNPARFAPKDEESDDKLGTFEPAYVAFDAKTPVNFESNDS